MKRLFKKTITILLMAGMLVGSVPVSAFAAERIVMEEIPDGAIIVEPDEIPEGAVITPVELEADPETMDEPVDDGQNPVADIDEIESLTEDMDMEDFMSLMYMMMLMGGMDDEEQDGPLTPDGNLTLVDDYGSTTGQGKQFITLTTKTGEYFYLIIDRDDSGNETVHFLNQVDNTDILRYMEDEEVAEYDAWQTSIDERKAQLQAEEDALKAAKEALENGEEPDDVSGNTADTDGNGTEPVKINSQYLIYGGAIVIFGAVAFIYTKKRKKKQTSDMPEEEDPWDDYDDETGDTEITDVPDDEKNESEDEQ